jgi:hypothetical protein
MPLSLTLAFSSHRPEVLPLAADLMARHDQIVVEEPPTPEFESMLTGAVPLEDYLLSVDFEYPDFVRATARLLQTQAARGRRVWACEPFTARLIRIHEHLADGGRPLDLESDAHLGPVYAAERRATGRLLAFYNAAATADFDQMLPAVCAFAEADAARFVLRDRLRAQAIAQRLAGCRERVYVEAGYMHLRMLRELRRQLPSDAAIRPHYLLQNVYRTGGHRGHYYGPGDRLTLAFIFDRRPAPERQLRMAARSLIYTQLIMKEEMAPDADAFPDAREEMRVITLVDRLSLEACRRLHAQFKGLKSLAVRRAVVGLPESVLP